MSAAKLVLHSVPEFTAGMGCSPTALCAVTGLPRADIDRAMDRQNCYGVLFDVAYGPYGIIDDDFPGQGRGRTR